MSRTCCSATTLHRKFGSQLSRNSYRGPGSAQQHFVLWHARDTSLLYPRHLHVHGRAGFYGLEDDAISLRELQELVEIVLGRLGRDIEAQPHLAEADRRILGDTERAAEIEVTLRRYRGRIERNIERR